MNTLLKFLHLTKPHTPMLRVQHPKLMLLIVLISMAVFLSSCGWSRTASINSTPPDATVKVDGEIIGNTPIETSLYFPEEGQLNYRITGSKEGYHDATVVVNNASLANSSQVLLELESQNKPAVILSNPSQATVKIGNQEVGRTPLEYTFNFENRNRRYFVAISKPGFLDSIVQLNEKSPQLRTGSIEVVLEDDPAWTSTSESEATNTWLRIQVDPRINYADAWQKVIDSVTSVYDSLEQLDQTSGYLRSTAKLKEFDKGNEGPFYVRTQFIGSISSAEPLTYKIKIISKTRLKSESDQNWKDFDRVFAEDAILVEELIGRLGLK